MTNGELNKIELYDLFEDTLWPVMRFKPAFDYKIARFSPLDYALQDLHSKDNSFGKEEAPLKGPLSFEITTNQDEKLRPAWFYEEYLKGRLSLDNLSVDVVRHDHDGDGDQDGNRDEGLPKRLTPAKILASFGEGLNKDIENMKALQTPFVQGEFGFLTEGDPSLIYIDPEASVSKGAALDTTQGPIVILKGAKVSPFSFIKGPCFIGEYAQVDKASVENVRLGVHCRIGGEVADSVLGDYSNKHHEGFVGHSILGEWVNLGAITTTSDLKNNYGPVRLTFQNRQFETGTIKFGSVIGDHVKTAIGTMLNTGTIIDACSLIFSGAAGRPYYPPFFWGGEKETRYKFELFMKDSSKIMARRSQNHTAWFARAVRELFDI